MTVTMLNSDQSSSIHGFPGEFITMFGLKLSICQLMPICSSTAARLASFVSKNPEKSANRTFTPAPIRLCVVASGHMQLHLIIRVDWHCMHLEG